MGARYFGAAVPCIEDPDLLAGHFLDDIALAGLLHGPSRARLRPSAHARIRGSDVTAAAALPGVFADVADLGPGSHDRMRITLTPGEYDRSGLSGNVVRGSLKGAMRPGLTFGVSSSPPASSATLSNSGSRV